MLGFWASLTWKKPRKELIVPIIEPRETFIEKWKNVGHEPMGFEEGSAEFYSDNAFGSDQNQN
ncbi:hypothetical protein [Butyrivibrio sp. WCD3002]|uniref:hypothetical protein n=1 Tax=Butyrivibrio sp. WCD3002 TaxID=1280676 RepID=UPI00047C02B5|nr:hypothetical protein [Butyrivibrio sp. WCD3002]